MEKKINKFSLEPNGNMQRRVELTDFELEMLLYLAKHRILTSQQIAFYYLFYYNKTPSNTIRTKLKTWNKKKVIKTIYTTTKQHYSRGFNSIRIETNGIKFLIQKGLLPQEWENVELTDFEVDKHIDHTIGTQEIVLRTNLSLKKRGIHVESINPNDPLFTEGDSTLIIPDWIMKVDNRVLNIELDNGTETPKVLKEKVERYIKIAKQNPTTQYAVLFSLMDGSIPNTEKEYLAGEKRLSNVKNGLLNIKELHQPNLTVYVSLLEHSYQIAENFLRGIKQLDENEVNLQVDLAQKSLSEMNIHFGYKFSPVENKEIYLSDVPLSLQADRIAKLSNLAQTHTELNLFILMDEGNVNTLDRLNHLHLSLKKGNFKQRVDKIIAFYTSKKELENDINGINFHKNVLFGDLETWTEDMNQEPKFYRSTSAYRLGVGTFEN